MGYQPSYASRSLMYAKEMFELGAKWMIGDEKQINVWGDIWMSEKHNFKVLGSVNLLIHVQSDGIEI